MTPAVLTAWPPADLESHHDEATMEQLGSSVRLTYFGNFFGWRMGIPQPCELLVECWRRQGMAIDAVSESRNRLARSAGFFWAASRARTRRDTVVVDTFSGKSLLWAIAVERLVRGRCPTILVLHGGDLPLEAERHPRRIRNLLGHATAVISPSGYMAEILASYAHGIRVIPNPLDMARYVPRQGARVPVPAAPRVLWLRAFHRMYDPVRAVEALAICRRTCPGATLTMMGADKDGSLREVTRAARGLGVLDAVRLSGPIPKTQVPEVMRMHDIFLSTSRVDNAPVTVVEAMGCGLPVVATDVGGVPHLLAHGIRGLLVPRADAPAMASAIAGIAANEPLAARLSAEGRRFAEESDIEKVTALWFRLIAEVTEEGCRRRVRRDTSR